MKFGVKSQIGHNEGNYCWIMPVDIQVVDEEISIVEHEEYEVSIDLSSLRIYLLDKIFLANFDKTMEFNRLRKDSYLVRDDNGYTGFGWDLTYNFYTKRQIIAVANEIQRIISILRCKDNTGSLGYKYDDLIEAILLGHMNEETRFTTIGSEEKKRVYLQLKYHLNVVDIINGYSKFLLLLNLALESLKSNQIISVMTP